MNKLLVGMVLGLAMLGGPVATASLAAGSTATKPDQMKTYRATIVTKDKKQIQDTCQAGNVTDASNIFEARYPGGRVINIGVVQ